MDYSLLPNINSILLELNRPADPLLTDAAREAVDVLRQQMAAGGCEGMSRDALQGAAIRHTQAIYAAKISPHLRRVINATGVVLHTNLGRAVLPEAAVAAIGDVARGYSNLELELADGKRSSRFDHVREALIQLTGADDALVVNNNAGAVLLSLCALAHGGEAIVSRGQLVEIGGGFRVPDIMEQAGIDLAEVGTTNKTRLADYEQAINSRSRVLLRVHPSNFSMEGFVESVGLRELVRLGAKYNLPVLDDLGSGCLFPLAALGIGHEPLVLETVSAGADVVTFSGDKLLGGPQAGIIVGKQAYIDKIKRHPWARALRVDKFTLAALEATLRIYRLGQEREAIPTLAMITATASQVNAKTSALAELLSSRAPELFAIRAVELVSPVGGGSLPGVELPTCCLQVEPTRISSARLLELLRQGTPAAIGFIRDNKAMFDPRTIFEAELAELAELIIRACEGEQ